MLSLADHPPHRSTDMPCAPALALAAMISAHAAVEGTITAITGATLVDISHGGRSTGDIPDAVVVIRNGRIIAAGPRGATPVPAGAKVMDRPGAFILPGLVDGFTGLQNQAEANAELYEGVTTVVGSGDDRRGHLFERANPSPHVYPIDSAGSTDDWSLLREQSAWRNKLAEGSHPRELTPAETDAQLDATAKRGTRAIWIGWNVTPAHTRAIIARSHALGMVAYGEFIATTCGQGIEDGVDALLHMSRYELGLAPAALFRSPDVAEGRNPGAAGYEVVDAIDPGSPRIVAYGRTIAEHKVALIPTFSLFYTTLPRHRNLWKEPAAGLLDPKSLFMSSDPATGDPRLPDPVRARLVKSSLHLWDINGALLAQRPVYLAASGASALGALPGISLHVELELLVRQGLTARQALAAATSNYADQFGWRELGMIAPGRRADILIVNADPTADIRNADKIQDVILAGVPLDRKALLQTAKTPGAGS